MNEHTFVGNVTRDPQLHISPSTGADDSHEQDSQRQRRVAVEADLVAGEPALRNRSSSQGRPPPNGQLDQNAD